MKSVSKDFIPIYKPFVANNQKKYVNDCLDTNWISSKGGYIDKFELAVADYLDVKHVVTTCNGTVSLMLIYAAAGLRPGDEVLVPSLTYCATISPLNWLGIRPVLIDSDSNYQMKIDDLDRYLTRRTAAVVVPQLYGGSPNMDKLVEFCNQSNLCLIEDSAESFGCLFNGKQVGRFGSMSSFSFFGNKVITTGEGGCVATNNDELAKKLKLLKSQAHIGGFVHDGPGFNFRMTNLQAAIGLAQMEQVDQIITRKKKIATYYRNMLSKDVGRITSPGVESSEWMPLFTLPDTMSYLKFHTVMQSRNVDIRPCFTPIHLMKGFTYDKKGSLDTSEKIYTKGFNLPSYPDLTDDQLEYIVECVNAAVEIIE